MPWWALAYLATYGVFSVAGIVDDRSEGRSWGVLIWGALALCCEVLLVIAFFHVEIAEAIGLFAVLFFLTSVGFAMTSTAIDLRSGMKLADDERALLPAAIVVNVCLYAPAFLLGWMVMVRSFSLKGD